MRTRNVFLLLLGLVGCARPEPRTTTPTIALWDDASARELLTLQGELNGAWANGDLELIKNSLADDAFVTSFHLDARAQPAALKSKDELLAFAGQVFADIKQRGGMVTIVPRGTECRATGTFGVCTNEFDLKMNFGEKTEMLSFRATSVSRKRPDGWKIIHWHSSLATTADSLAATPRELLEAAPKYNLAAYNTSDLKWTEPADLPKGTRVAVVWGQLDRGPFAAFVQLAKGMKLEAHSHPENQWITVLKGDLQITESGGKVMSVGPKGYLLQPAGKSHTTATNAGATFFVIGDGPHGRTRSPAGGSGSGRQRTR